MALYTKQFEKTYHNGYVNKPQKTTPVTAEILNMQDRVFEALEDFLTSDDVGFKKGLTVGQRQGTSSEVGKFSLLVGTGKSSGQASCAFGQSNTVSGDNASVFGQGNTASGINAAAFGAGCESSGALSHAVGSNVKAKGHVSYAEGDNTIASGAVQHVQGKYNVEDTENEYAHIVGNGAIRRVDGVLVTERSNAHTLDWQGNAWFAGDVTNGNGVSLDELMELVRNSAVDLSNYCTKPQVEQLLSGYVRTETGKGLSANDYTDEEKQLIESIMNMTTENALEILNGEVV